jgi:hypothetical protein
MDALLQLVFVFFSVFFGIFGIFGFFEKVPKSCVWLAKNIVKKSLSDRRSMTSRIMLTMRRKKTDVSE